PVPGCSSGEVWTLTMATRRISSSTLTTAAYAAALFPLPDGAEGRCAAYPPGVARNRPVGVVTRGTTNPNRLRRVGRRLADVAGRRLRAAARTLDRLAH